MRYLAGVKERLEEIRRKYRVSESSLELISLKKEIELYINCLRSEENYEELVKEAEDMLIDVTFKIEESRCGILRGLPK